jgi:hypothetical protein
MAVAVVISTVTLGPDGYVHVTGTVAGVAVGPVQIDAQKILSLPFTVAAIQEYLAVQLVIASGEAVPIASLTGTVNL